VSFAELLAHPGVEEVVELRSRFGFMAFHGGNLEAATDTIAAAAALEAGASLYAVIQPPDLRWHLPSVAFDPEVSPALAAFVDHVDVAVAVHGYGGEGFWTTLLLGGRHRELAHHLAGHLRAALPDFDIVDDLDSIPVRLRGVHPANPVNRPAGGGVQLELPPRVRGTSPASKPEYLTGVIGALASGAAAWPHETTRVPFMSS
jgi:phage replication-related protein YjqB (UPF0714/DUF867 family)